MRDVGSFLVYVVDDDPGEAELSRTVLRRLSSDTRVTVFNDGRRLLERIRSMGSSLDDGQSALRFILLDLNMPHMNGFDVLSGLRAEESTKAIPVVVFSSSDSRQDIAESFARGANSYIVKPTDAEEFERVLSAVGSYWLDLNESDATRNLRNVEHRSIS